MCVCVRDVGFCVVCSRRVCFCAVGFPRKLQSEKGRSEFLKEVDAIEGFLNDPWLIKAREDATVQVAVPKVAVSAAARLRLGGEEAAVSAASAQVKRIELQKQGAAASIAGEDCSGKFGSGDLVVRVLFFEVDCFMRFCL